MNSQFGSWEAYNVPNIWDKPCSNLECFIPWESSQNINIKNDIHIFQVLSYKLNPVKNIKS
jgi:hypothetical protein